MDRNEITITDIDFRIVALRKESVDRNLVFIQDDNICVGSLSVRRAWIEISMSCNVEKFWAVALRKESVDRNAKFKQYGNYKVGRSP